MSSDITPNLAHVTGNHLCPLVMKRVQTPGSIGSIKNETCFLEEAQMAGHGWPTDRQSIGHLLDRAITIGQHLDDRAAMRISESGEGIAFEGLSGDGDQPPRAARLSPSASCSKDSVMSGIDLEIIGSNKPENTSSIENSVLPLACG